MTTILFSLPDFYASYKKWVAQNPLKAGDYEVTLKWISYFVAGRINNSHILSELVYCLSNLIVLFNDKVISDFYNLEKTGSGDKLKLWLTVLEYCEVFLELSARKVLGVTGKWLVIASVQIFKCISRLLLIYHHKEPIIQHPPIPVLHRRDFQKITEENGSREVAQAQFETVCFNLKRSGKTIRKIDASPPLNVRTWKPLQLPKDNEVTVQKALAGRLLLAETLYVVKPIVHLGSMACFGTNNWKPWILSLLFELGSLQLYNSNPDRLKQLSGRQRMEVSRRYVALVMYLLRSPFYEAHSRDRISALLSSLSANVPLAAAVCGPLEKYIPFWQSKYFYMWST